jgi:hypothetical protein
MECMVMPPVIVWSQNDSHESADPIVAAENDPWPQSCGITNRRTSKLAVGRS